MPVTGPITSLEGCPPTSGLRAPQQACASPGLPVGAAPTPCLVAGGGRGVSGVRLGSRVLLGLGSSGQTGKGASMT